MGRTRALNTAHDGKRSGKCKVLKSSSAVGLHPVVKIVHELPGPAAGWNTIKRRAQTHEHIHFDYTATGPHTHISEDQHVLLIYQQVEPQPETYTTHAVMPRYLLQASVHKVATMAVHRPLTVPNIRTSLDVPAAVANAAQETQCLLSNKEV